MAGQTSDSTIRQGVRDSSVFVLFLTNSAIGGGRVRHEIGWALEADRPVIIIVETEARFWNWDVNRWEDDVQIRTPSNGWTQGLPPSTQGYSSCPKEIKALVEDHADRTAMLPFRRQEFEFNALVREVLRRSSLHPGIVWGAVLPKDRDQAAALATDTRTVHVIYDFSSSVAHCMKESILGTMTMLAPNIKADNYLVKRVRFTPVQIICILTGGVLSSKRSLDEITNAVERCAHSEIICVYKESGKDKWDWDSVGALRMERSDILSKVQASLWGHEAYKYRPPQPLHQLYEHQAMVANMIVRMPSVLS